MEWTDSALVVHVGRFREADLCVRLLTPGQGLVTAFAFGASKSRRRFTGCLDIFNLIRTRASTSRNGLFLNLQEATLLEGPERLRTDWQRQGLAANCIRFVEALGVPPDGAAAAFALTRDLLALLENASIPPALTPFFFRFRLASDQGYAPDLTQCSHCGRPLDQPEDAWFLVAEGVTRCAGCRPRGAVALPVSREALDVLCKVQEYSPGLWSDFTVSPESGRQIGRLIDAFVRYHLGLEWINGRFRRSR